MLKQRVLLLLATLIVANPAPAGLFSDRDARKQIEDNRKETQQIEARLQTLEERSAQQTRSMLDLLSQIEALNAEIRRLRGQNEELMHGLQDGEKRAKDFYLDLDTRLRHFESAEEAGKETPPGGNPAAPASTDSSDPVAENRAFEAAYALFREGRHADAVKAFEGFQKKYPESVHVPNSHYWSGSAKQALKDCRGAVEAYQRYLKASPASSRAPDVLLDIAGCQQQLKQQEAARKTLRQLVAKYPSSQAAAKAKKQLGASQ